MAEESSKAVEFRGVDNLVYAEVIEDSADGIEFGDVKPLAPVAEIARSASSDSATKYYDNAPRIVVRSNGADEVTITTAVLPLGTLAEITGQYYDSALDMIVEGDPEEKYYAIGYRTKDTSGAYRYVWRLKGQFSIPEEDSKTEDDSTDSNGQELTYTGLKTTFKFEKGGKGAKDIVVQEGKADVSTWFDQVQTPDTVQAKPGTLQS